MSEPSLSPLSRATPPPPSDEPIRSEAPRPEPLMCTAAEPDSAERGSAGSQALVRRFAPPLGAGGAGAGNMDGGEGAGGVGRDDGSRSSRRCGDDVLRTLASCTGMVLAGARTGGLVALSAGVGCLGAVEGMLECFEEKQQAGKP